MDDKNSAAHAELYADHSVVAEQSAAELAAEMAQARRLAERYRLPFLDLAHFNIDHDLFRTIPAELMLRYGFVPYRREGNALAIVVSDPTDLPMIDELGMLLGTPIKVMVAPASAIQAILKKSESSTRVLEDATESFQLQILREDEQGEDQLTVEKLTTDTSPVIRLVDTTIYTAIQRRASDIHIETADDAVYVKYRIDGVLQSAMRPIDKRFHSTIISRIKVMAELDIAEKRVPQDGRFKLRLPGKTIDFRVSVMPSAHGEDVVIRILDKESISEQFTELRLDILGFPDAELKRFRKYIAEPYGMVLVTGPTGSGKTTTLYSALAELNKIANNISTAEDPIEFNLAGINQVQMHEEIGLNFAAALRAFLRQDPDIIMVGEIRDFETAEIGVKAALTGHLVLSTLHTNDAPSTINRLLNMGIEPFLVASSVNLILAQRLARVICANCKEDQPVAEDVLKKIGWTGKPFVPQHGTGCVNCGGTGFRGRIALYEVMPLTDGLREQIIGGGTAIELKRVAIQDGMASLRQAGLIHVARGTTTIEEVLRVTMAD
jgi:type IV pilus assembly protein PilB